MLRLSSVLLGAGSTAHGYLAAFLFIMQSDICFPLSLEADFVQIRDFLTTHVFSFSSLQFLRPSAV